MRTTFILFALILAGFFACTKKGTVTPNNNGGNNGGGNNGGGNTGSLTITSISPEHPYPDDTITINGSGFTADLTKDTVEFGDVHLGGFNPWHEGTPSEYGSITKVISATATKLVITAINPLSLDQKAFAGSGFVDPYGPSPACVAGIRVKTAGKQVQTTPIAMKRYFTLTGIHNPESNNIQYGRPNDSLQFLGQGFDTTGVTFSIGSTQTPPDKITHYLNNYTAGLRLSKTFFGTDNDENANITVPVAVINPDGKMSVKDCVFYTSPIMRVTNMHPEQPSYSHAQFVANGGVVKIYISGSCLKSDAYITAGNGAGFSTQVSLGVTGFPDSTSVDLDGLSLPLGNYTVYLNRNNAWVAGCNFSIHD